MESYGDGRFSLVVGVIRDPVKHQFDKNVRLRADGMLKEVVNMHKLRDTH